MANEPIDLVLIHLREIRATLAEHSARFERIDERFDQMQAQMDERFDQVDERFAQIDGRFVQMSKRFDRLEKRFEDLHAIASHTFALSTANSIQLREHEQRLQLGEEEQKRIARRVEELERKDRS